MLGERRFIFKQLQPEESRPFGGIGTGWGGVYRWCQQAVFRSGGRLRDDFLFFAYDMLIIQLDADVAEKSYADLGIQVSLRHPNPDLPCQQPCPPASATTDLLRNVLLRWCGESQTPPKTVLCTPSKSLETWVVASLFPNDAALAQQGECLSNPESRLSQQPVDLRIEKSRRDYSEHRDDFQSAWPRLVNDLSEARRFHADFVAAASPS